MTAATTEYYGKLLCALIELQLLCAELVGQLSVQHARGNSSDPNIALANVLADQETAVKNLKSMTYSCNKTKIYVSKNPPILRNPIDVKVIDTTLQHDFLLWLEGFPVSKPSNANRNNQVRCAGACAQLRRRMDVCCDRCMQCNACNDHLPTLQQCPTYKLKLGLEKDKSLRNLVSHLTLKTLENFLNGTEGFPDFPHVNNWQDLCQQFVNTMTCISGYMGDANNFNNPNVKLLQQHEKMKKLDKLQTILNKNMKTECDLNLLTNLKEIMKEQHQKQIDEVEKVVANLKDTITKNHIEVTAKLDILKDGQTNTHLKLDALKDDQDILQDGQRNGHLKLDALKDGQDNLLKLMKGHIEGETSSDHQLIEQKSKERQNNWRSIAGGVVVRLDLSESEGEVSDVCFSSKDGEHHSSINHKSSIIKVGEPYYETHKVDECNMLLKIENMKDGNYIIEVVRTSSKSTFDVCVNYTFNNPANIIKNKVGIGIPSSDNKQYWEQLTKTILDASLNEDRIIAFPLSRGASTKTQTLKEFEEIGAKYIERNFSENFACIDPFGLLQKEYTKNVAECFEKLLKDRFVSRKRRVILVAPNIAYHSGLISNASVKNESQNRDEHCMMVFLEEISLVLVVRISSQAVDISGEIVHIKDDIEHLVNIHGHRLNEENLTIAGIIACPSVEREQLKDVLPFQFADVHTKLYETLFICKDDLNTETNQFTKWWDTSFSELKKQLDIPDTRTKSRFFSNMIGEHMVSMATVNESLPTLSCNPHDQMRTLILNTKQHRAINSSSTKKHIIGPFGCGKTLVGQSILKNLLKKLKKQDERSTLCYITCDEYSIVDCHVKKTMESLINNKVKFICGSLRQLYQEHINSNLSSNSVSLDKLLKALTEKYPNPHFVCDEVQSSVMTLDVAKTINGYLKTILLDAHVVFIQQSIMKDREYQQHSLEADHFNLIERLEVHRLQKVMRIAMENQQLVDAAQQIIGKHKLSVAIPKRNRKETNTRVAVKTKSRVVVGVEDVSQTTTASSSRLPAENILTPTTKDMSQGVFEDFDLSLKVLSRSQSNKTKQNTLTTSILFFDGKIGHEISGDRANLIHLPNTNDRDNIKIISLVLTNCFFQGTSPVFIASSLQSAKMLNHGAKACNKETVVYIPYLQQRNPTPKEKDEVLSMTPNSSVLITDHKSFLGMEHEVVVTIADPTETIIRHSIVEIISRCTCNLFVFVLSQNKKSVAGSMGEILDTWVADDLVNTMHVTLECGDENSGAIKICESTVDKNADVIVNTKSSEFVLLTEIIDRFDEEEFRVHLEDEVYQTSKFLHSKIEEVAAIGDEDFRLRPSFRRFFSKFLPSKIKEVAVVEDEEQRIFPELTHDETTWTFNILDDLLADESTRDKFNGIITSEPSLAQLRYYDNQTLLHKALRHGATECVEVLIANGCDVREKDDRGITAIHYAAHYNYTRVIEILLFLDPSLINATNIYNHTPLHYAAWNNHPETVELLLSQPSIDVNVKDRGGRTPDEQWSTNDEIKRMIRNHRDNSSSRT